MFGLILLVVLGCMTGATKQHHTVFPLIDVQHHVDPEHTHLRICQMRVQLKQYLLYVFILQIAFSYRF